MTLYALNIILIFYLVPFIVAYIGTRWEHTHGKYRNSDMSAADILFVLLPLVNIIASCFVLPSFFMAILGMRDGGKSSADELVRRFFRINKRKY